MALKILGPIAGSWEVYAAKCMAQRWMQSHCCRQRTAYSHDPESVQTDIAGSLATTSSSFLTTPAPTDQSANSQSSNQAIYDNNKRSYILYWTSSDCNVPQICTHAHTHTHQFSGLTVIRLGVAWWRSGNGTGCVRASILQPTGRRFESRPLHFT